MRQWGWERVRGCTWGCAQGENRASRLGDCAHRRLQALGRVGGLCVGMLSPEAARSGKRRGGGAARLGARGGTRRDCRREWLPTHAPHPTFHSRHDDREVRNGCGDKTVEAARARSRCNLPAPARLRGGAGLPLPPAPASAPEREVEEEVEKSALGGGRSFRRRIRNVENRKGLELKVVAKTLLLGPFLFVRNSLAQLREEVHELQAWWFPSRTTLDIAVLVAYLHWLHLVKLCENYRHFSHLSSLEREMTFCTEMVRFLLLTN
ncbi:probable C-mannosyltransferase DPY19L2 [Pan paniscus]|uniref:probable C-mannosyltransferase DPY19L2 n=1 Tax=Pan paniscus TaxID=9597 RepID=UPI002436E5A8|nr:probable C-mannosyltransferase DPY19L2 [Pan paniscus]